MARHLAYWPSLVSSSRSFTFAKIASCATRGICSQKAVAATQRSASCCWRSEPTRSAWCSSSRFASTGRTPTHPKTAAEPAAMPISSEYWPTRPRGAQAVPAVGGGRLQPGSLRPRRPERRAPALPLISSPTGPPKAVGQGSAKLVGERCPECGPCWRLPRARQWRVRNTAMRSISPVRMS